MNDITALPTLLLIAWLLPLVSFTIICIAYSLPQMLGIRVRYATQKYAGYIAIGAIVTGFLLSIYSLFGIWLPEHPLKAATHHGEEHEEEPDPVAGTASPFRFAAMQEELTEEEGE